MEAIKDILGIRCLFPDYLEVWHPHIATYKFEIPTAFFAKFMKETEQGFGLALHTAPEKPPRACIQLINHGQVLVPLEYFDLVHPDFGNVVEVSVGKAVFDHMLNCPVDALPTGLENVGGLFP